MLRQHIVYIAVQLLQHVKPHMLLPHLFRFRHKRRESFSALQEEEPKVTNHYSWIAMMLFC